MAGVLHKFLKNSSALRIITRFNNREPSNLLGPFVVHQTHVSDIKPDSSCKPNPILGSLKGEKPTNLQSSQIYPSFPFGYFSNPVYRNGSVQVEAEEAEDVGYGDSQTVWADSVKKKRKKKMNKHKYKKLRKRLRRKT